MVKLLYIHPEEIIKLTKAIEGDYDLVIGRFKEKKHSLFRRLGSRLIGKINRRIFRGQKDLVLTNFRIIHRSVIEIGRQYVPGIHVRRAAAENGM